MKYKLKTCKTNPCYVIKLGNYSETGYVFHATDSLRESPAILDLNTSRCWIKFIKVVGPSCGGLPLKIINI